MSLRAKCGYRRARAGPGWVRTSIMPGPVWLSLPRPSNLALDDAGPSSAPTSTDCSSNPGISWFKQSDGVGRTLQNAMGIRDPAPDRDDETLEARPAAAMVMHARTGYRWPAMANVVRMRIRRRSAASAFRRTKSDKAGSAASYGYAQGLKRATTACFGVNAQYAFVAQRHMYKYGDHQRSPRRGCRGRAAIGPT